MVGSHFFLSSVKYILIAFCIELRIWMNIPTLYNTMFLCFGLIWLISCAEESQTPGEEENRTEVPELLNPDFSGSIFIGGDGDGPWILDLASGHYTPIPGVDWEDNPNFFHAADFSAFPSRDGTEFVETIRECVNLGGFDREDCLLIRDKEGLILEEFRVPYETFGPAKLSFDKQFIAIPIQNPSSSLNPAELTLYTRTGERVEKGRHDVHSRKFDWLPDNRILYCVKQDFYLTEAGAAQGIFWGSIPEEFGEPDHLAVSPDGSKVAFTLKTSVNFSAIHGTTWILDIATKALVQLTTSPGEGDSDSIVDEPIINFPAWSPDGRWIAVVDGAVRVSSQVVPGAAKGELYLVPSDGEKVLLTQSEPTDAIPIRSYFEETFDWIDPETADLQAHTRFNVFEGSIFWYK